MFLNIPLHNCSTANKAVTSALFCLTGSSILPGRWQISHFTKWCPDVGKSEPFLSIRDGYTPQPLLSTNTTNVSSILAGLALEWQHLERGQHSRFFSESICHKTAECPIVQIYIFWSFAIPCCAYYIQDCSLYAKNHSENAAVVKHRATSKTNSTNACVIFVLYNSSISWS